MNQSAFDPPPITMTLEEILRLALEDERPASAVVTLVDGSGVVFTEAIGVGPGWIRGRYGFGESAGTYIIPFAAIVSVKL